MNSPSIEDVVANARRLTRSSPIAKIILEHCASFGNNRAELTVDRLLELLAASGRSIARGEVVRALKELDACGCGKFIAGRRSLRSRFMWRLQMVPFAKAVLDAGAPSDIAELNSAPIPEPPAHRVIVHRYHLRPDLEISVSLPGDLEEGEARKLADWARTLWFAKQP